MPIASSATAAPRDSSSLCGVTTTSERSVCGGALAQPLNAATAASSNGRNATRKGGLGRMARIIFRCG